MRQISLAQRNVFVYDASGPQAPTLVAGCRQFGGTTNAELYFCLGMCFQRPRAGEFRLVLLDGTILPNDSNTLPVGDYYVATPGTARPSSLV